MTTEQTTQPVDEQLEADVDHYLELTEHIEKLEEERASIKARLATRAAGSYPTSLGVTVTVKAPSRTFNTTKAWEFLSAAQQAVAMSPDAKKIKAQLPGVIVESLMEPGTGNPTVTVK